MQFRRYILAFAVLVLLLSCTEKKDAAAVSVLAEEAVEVEIVQNAINIPLSIEEEVEKIRDIIQTVLLEDDFVVHLARVDFGVPGGENWLIRIRYPSPEGNSFVYGISLNIINEDEIIKSYYLGPDSDLSRYTEYDIMKDIPGTRMGNNAASAYGDYNDDGVIEVF
jgi:hypothetical protein